MLSQHSEIPQLITMKYVSLEDMKVFHPRGYESGLPRESSRPLV